MLEERFDGLKSLYWADTEKLAMRNYPLQEKLLPSSNLASAGLHWTGLGDVQLTFRNMLYMNALPINPFYVILLDAAHKNSIGADISMTRKARSYANFYWAIPIQRATITADFNFITIKYLRTGSALDTNTMLNAPFDPTIFHENDLWSDYSLSLRLLDDVYANFDAKLKQNMSGHSFMNLYRYRIELNGTGKFPQKNQITWVVAGEQYQRYSQKNSNERYFNTVNDILKMATRPLIYLYMRDVFTISRGLFLKGTAILEGGNNLLKERYEISLRKAWKNCSYVEPGYVTSLGGLFPIQSAYVRSCIQATKSFGITPMVKCSWEAEENYDKKVMEVSFLKMLSSLELSYAIRNRTELFLGGNFTSYNKDVVAGFPNRFGVYFGLQSIIP
jgi:hypothetical protein